MSASMCTYCLMNAFFVSNQVKKKDEFMTGNGSSVIPQELTDVCLCICVCMCVWRREVVCSSACVLCISGSEFLPYIHGEICKNAIWTACILCINS